MVHYLLNQAIQANCRDWLEDKNDNGRTALDCLDSLLNSASASKERQSLEGLKGTIESYLLNWEKLRQPDYKPITNPNQRSLFNQVTQTLFASFSNTGSESSGDNYSPRAKEALSPEPSSSSDDECPHEPLLKKKNQ